MKICSFLAGDHYKRPSEINLLRELSAVNAVGTHSLDLMKFGTDSKAVGDINSDKPFSSISQVCGAGRVHILSQLTAHLPQMGTFLPVEPLYRIGPTLFFLGGGCMGHFTNPVLYIP